MNKDNHSILVVDDEREACAIINRFLKKKGFETVSVFDGATAVEYVRQHSPDAVVLDIRMPGIDGVETLKRIRSFNNECAIIMLTAIDELGVALDTIRSGADDFLRKPVMLPELEITLDSEIEKHRLRKENEEYQKGLEIKVGEQTKHLQKLNEYLTDTNIKVVRALSKTVEAKDVYTKGHCERVTEISLKIGMEIGLSDNDLEALEYGAVLHDIGKIGVREDLLNKPGKLTDKEYDQVKTHTTIGFEIIKDIDFMKRVKHIVRNHHERLDGEGYPDRLAGKQVNVLSRVVALADAYDAMTSDRAYRNSMTNDRALSIISDGKGSQFDPELADIFIGKRIFEN